MKYIIILGDGMADEPVDKLGGKTPLQVANTPAMDKLAKLGRCGLFSTVPKSFTPGSEIANLTVLGWQPPSRSRDICCATVPVWQASGGRPMCPSASSPRPSWAVCQKSACG